MFVAFAGQVLKAEVGFGEFEEVGEACGDGG